MVIAIKKKMNLSEVNNSVFHKNFPSSNLLEILTKIFQTIISKQSLSTFPSAHLKHIW